MVKKALCVGINDYPGEGSDLNGCVNDARAWADVLTHTYGFSQDGVKLLLDAEATKAAIIDGLRSLLSDAGSGDILVFTNSSHGTYIADTSGDEPAYDEAMCPYDCDDELIVDDELRELFSDVAKGVSLIVVSDSCFSGTVTRAAVYENFPGIVPVNDDRHIRFLNPALLGRPILDNPWTAKNKSKDKFPQSRMKEILLSGCTDHEYSYDAYIEGKYHGAMTYYAIKAIQEGQHDLNYAQVRSRLVYLLTSAGYPQHPQLEGKVANKKRRVFS